MNSAITLCLILLARTGTSAAPDAAGAHAAAAGRERQQHGSSIHPSLGCPNLRQASTPPRPCCHPPLSSSVRRPFTEPLGPAAPLSLPSPGPVVRRRPPPLHPARPKHFHAHRVRTVQQGCGERWRMQGERKTRERAACCACTRVPLFACRPTDPSYRTHHGRLLAPPAPDAQLRHPTRAERCTPPLRDERATP